MKVVYITNGMSSTLNSSFELSRRLCLAGHEVVYLSPADVGDLVHDQGYEFVRLAADQNFVGARSSNTGRSGLVERWRLRRASIENDEIERTVQLLAPDALLIDIEMHFAILSTAGLELPTLLPIVWFSIFRHADLPPLHTLAPAPRSAVERLWTRFAWWKLRLSNLHMEWRQRLSRWARGDLFPPVEYDTFSIDDLRAVARSRGLSLRRIASRSDWLRPLLYRDLPVLCMNAREMDFPHEPASQLHYVGPMVNLERRETMVGHAARAEWQAFQSGRRSERPLVYCSLGTFWSADREFLRRVIAVFERRADWDLVLGLGGVMPVEKLAPVPVNVLLMDFAPQLEVLALARCAITHGGITTINECVELGVPMVVYSTGHVDQNGCAARLEHHRLAITGDRVSDTSDDMERKIEKALMNRGLHERTLEMSRVFARYREPDSAVSLVERVGSSC